MDDRRVTSEQLQARLQSDFEQLTEQIAQAVNQAEAGRIIADSEEPVRDAHAEFRQRAYQHAMNLLQANGAQEDFSPSASRPRAPVEEQRQTEGASPDGERADRA